MRIRTYRIIVFFLFGFLLLALFHLQIIKGRQFYRLSLKNSIRLISQEPYRGRIFDRFGHLIVDNVLSFDVVVIPQELKDKRKVFKRLSEILSADEEEFYRIYKLGYLNPFKPVPIAKGIQKKDAIRIEEEKLELGGISIELNAKRFYPYASTASHIIGYMGEIDRSGITKLKDYGYDIKDKVGHSGVEERLDIYLRGEKGGRQVEVDSCGRQVRLLGYKPPLIGKDVYLTVDLELQQISDRLLKDKKGAVVILDVVTGEVLVMSSAPAFNPNVFVECRDKKTLNYLLTSQDAPLFNRAISGQFPPGSVFKVITALAAFKVKKFSPATISLCEGKLKVGDRVFKCWSVHKGQDFLNAMAHSCDIYFYKLGLMAQADSLAAVARDFGLSVLTGIELAGEAKGFIPTPLWKRLSRFEGWYDGDTVNFSIGQGYVLTTPLQVARMMAAVANGGYLVKPYLIKSIGGVVTSLKERKKIKVARQDLDVVVKSLRAVVAQETGTAHNLDLQGLDVCAKTGTAQVYDKKSHGWVAGFFPMHQPRYAFCILLENIGSSYYACQLGQELLEEGVRRKKFP